MNYLAQDYKHRLIPIDNPNSVLDAIFNIFIQFLKSNDYNNLKRLEHEKARNFYAKFLQWKIENTSYNEMINSFLSYWKYLEKNNKETLVFVDSKWGELTRDGHIPMWVDIREKSLKARVNLAIVRINDEQEFLDNVLFKFIDILYELGLIEKNFYHNVKYGTSDEKKIVLLKNGFSFSLTHLLIEDYINYVNIDTNNDSFYIEYELINAMENNNENDIMIFEVKQYLI